MSIQKEPQYYQGEQKWSIEYSLISLFPCPSGEKCWKLDSIYILMADIFISVNMMGTMKF
jgi:hypothetical protein